MFDMAEKLKQNSLKLKSKTYSARFLEAGVVKYCNDTVLIKNENLMNIAESFKGIPVIIDHQRINENNIIDLAVGYISKIYMGLDGWAWCDFNITNEKADDLIQNGYSVSCAYIPTKRGTGGVYHNISFSEEIIDGKGTHLALVSNPRYEDALIIENSKEKKMKIFKFKSKEKKEVKNSQEEIIENELENSLVEINGEKVEVSKLIEIYNNKLKADKKAEEEKQNTLNESDEVIINEKGEKVKVSELVNAYKESKNKCEEKNKMETKKKEDKDKKKKEDEKNNATDFAELKNAKVKSELENSKEEIESTYVSDSEKYEEGQKRYGSPQVINNK